MSDPGLRAPLSSTQALGAPGAEGGTTSSPTGARVTLQQVATRAGVSVSAASLALNDRPGVSSSTRVRVQQVAEKLGWSPNPAARALSSARANAIGFAMVRSAQVRRVDTYLLPLLSGMESAAKHQGVAFLLHFADTEAELASIYRRWRAGRHVDGVVLINWVDGDDRLGVLAELGLPAVAVGGQSGLTGIGTVSVDHRGITAQIIDYLWALGHRRIARVGGIKEFVHTQQRDTEFEAVLADLPGALDGYRVLHTDYSADAGRSAVRDLLAARPRPSAIVFDNDVMAAAALPVAREMGIDVPDELSIVAWDDSELCTLVHPSITAVAQDPYGQGQAAVDVLMDLVEGGKSRNVQIPSRSLQVRQSTSPYRGAQTHAD